MSDTRNDFNAHWAGIRQVDVRVGAGYALLGNVLLLAVLAFGDVSELGLQFSAVAIGANLLMWLWNDAGIRDVSVSTKDIAPELSDLAIVQEFRKAPWGMYRALVLVLHVTFATVLVMGALG